MNSFWSILLISIGSIGAASFYIPFKKVKQWNWETYWIVQGFAAWIILPWLFAVFNIPFTTVGNIIKDTPDNVIISTIFFGMLWGVGGLTFGLTIRYLGVALGQSIALGLCAAFGTIVPAVLSGQNLFSDPNGILILIGVSICLTGITIIGYAGSLKSKSLSEEEKKKAVVEFALKKGILIAILAGAMSASFNFGFQSALPIETIASGYNINSLYLKSVPLIFILTGGFITNFVYCMYLHFKNRSFKDYFTVSSKIFAFNLFYCFLAGTLWFLQFHFYGMGASQLPKSMSAFGWTILMSLNIAFSNIWGIMLNEWKGVSAKILIILITGITILILSTIIVGFGN